MKKTIVFLSLLILSASAYAEHQSILELSFTQDNKIYVSKVFDDDQSIEQLELFIVTQPTSQIQVTSYVLQNIVEGQVLLLDSPQTIINPPAPGAYHEAHPITASELDPKTIVYNFFDSDGTITNQKYFIHLLDYGLRLSQKANVYDIPHPLASKSISARKDEETKNYYIDIYVQAPTADSINFYYSYPENQSIQEEQSLALAETQSGVFTGSLGPFNDKITLNSRIRAIVNGFAYDYFFEEQVFYLVTKGLDGVCKAAFTSTKTKDNTQKAFFSSPQGGIIDAPPTGANDLSSIKIIEDTSFVGGSNEKGFKVLNVYDDLYAFQSVPSIETVDFVVIDPFGTSFSHSFSNVEEGETLSFVVPEDSTVYYNYFDSDGVTQNINFFLPVKKSDYITMPFFTVADHSTLLSEASIEVIPQSDCFSFKIKVHAKTNSLEEGVYLKYGFTDSDEPTFVPVQKNLESAGLKDNEINTIFLEGENEYTIELGPFESSSGFYADLYAENEQGQVDKFYGLNQWTSLALENASQEVCENFIDDDGDGEIDEGCTILPELFFLNSTISDFFVEGSPINFKAVIKNQGFENTAQSFDVAVILNNYFVALQKIEFLQSGEAKGVSFSIPNSSDFPGRNELKLLIDPTNDILESNKSNNQLKKTITIGKNIFRLVLPVESTVLGDQRQIDVFDRFSELVPEAQVQVNYPSGRVIYLNTSEEGTVNFLLEETGSYSISLSKETFQEFNESFKVSKIVLPNLKQNYGLGEQLNLEAKTEEGQSVSGLTATITTPLNETTTITSQENYRLSLPGTYTMTVFRNSVQVAQSQFLVSGFLESLFYASSVQDLLFGQSLINDLPLFLSMLMFSLIAAWLFYSKQSSFFPFKPQTTNQKVFASFLKIFIAILFFFIPFQINRLFGFNLGLLIALAEIGLVFMLDYNAKEKKHKKAIKI